jgi:predicted enzyme related to lactoylglutathione lyase
MSISRHMFVLLWLIPALAGCASNAPEDPNTHVQPEPDVLDPEEEKTMQVYYLEIVTPDMDATCDALEKLHGVSFGAPEAGLGNARTAALESGGMIGVRAPMHEAEEPVVRPYVLVDDLEAAVEAAEAAGGEIALPPTEIAGHGKFAIYIQGGIQHGLWQI